MRSLYGTLGVERRATRQEIKRAYYQAAHDCHPDKCPNDAEAAQRFRDISLAYTVLGDPAARKRYDLLGPMALGLSPSHTDLSILGPEAEQLAQALGSVVGGVMKRLRRRRARAVPEVKITIDVGTALRGGTRELRLDRLVPCPSCQTSAAAKSRPSAPSNHALAARCSTCRGKGSQTETVTYSLRIPADSSHRDLLRMGKAGPRGEDLLIRLELDPHPLIRCRGLNLYIDFPLRPSQAALGGPIALHLPHKTIRITLDPGAQAGDIIEVLGDGLRGLRGGKRGNLYVTLDIEAPNAATSEARAAWAALAEIERAQPSQYPRHEAFVRGMQA